MSIRSRAIALLVVGLVLLAGCSAGGTTDPTATATPTPISTPKAPATSPPAQSNPTMNGTLDVHVIDVGQGSSTLLVGPTNETMLIDTGDWQDSGEPVLQHLHKLNITRIDYLVTSHADADHIGGHAKVIEYLETEGDGIGAVYDPGIAASSQTYEDYLDAVEQYNVTLYQTQAGDMIPFAGTNVSVLAPPAGYLADEDRNENSLVLTVRYGNSSFLLPGDAAEAGEEYLLEHNRSALNVTVLQAGHHGSRSSSSGSFLDAATPAIAVISSAYDSQYGHPHNETLDRLAARDITTYWTGVHGSILLESNGSHVTIFAHSNATTEPAELKTAPAFTGNGSGEFVRRGVIEATGGTAQPVTDGGTATATQTITEARATLSVETIHADASGNDNDNLNDEYVTFENTGHVPLNLSGWSVQDDAEHTYQFPDGFTLSPGAQVTLYTGNGTDTATELYWDTGSPIWNNAGDTVIVRDDEGNVELEEAY